MCFPSAFDFTSSSGECHCETEVHGKMVEFFLQVVLRHYAVANREARKIREF
jgi:hypothetical protein